MKDPSPLLFYYSPDLYNMINYAVQPARVRLCGCELHHYFIFPSSAILVNYKIVLQPTTLQLKQHMFHIWTFYPCPILSMFCLQKPDQHLVVLQT